MLMLDSFKIKCQRKTKRAARFLSRKGTQKYFHVEYDQNPIPSPQSNSAKDRVLTPNEKGVRILVRINRENEVQIRLIPAPKNKYDASITL